jgi:hypothetical protein
VAASPGPGSERQWRGETKDGQPKAVGIGLRSEQEEQKRYGVLCLFGPKFTDRATKLSRGDVVSVVGKCAGLDK